MWKLFAVLVASTPFLIVFVGIGVLALNISATWDARNTDALISGLVASCGMGGVIMGGLLALLIGVPLAIRILRETHLPILRLRGATPPRGRPPVWLQEPPQVEMRGNEVGVWESAGPHAYDLAEDDATGVGEW